MYYLVARAAPEQVGDSASGFTIVLLVVAMGLVAGSLVVRNRLTAKTPPDPKRLRSGYVASLAMCEAAAIFGLVIRFTFGSPQYYLFFLIGLIGMLLNYPRKNS